MTADIKRIAVITGDPTLLTPKQENFCLVYLETGNASEAYR